MDSMALPSGDLLDILRAGGDDEDLLDFANLEWVFGEAVEEQRNEHQAQFLKEQQMLVAQHQQMQQQPLLLPLVPPVAQPQQATPTSGIPFARLSGTNSGQPFYNSIVNDMGDGMLKVEQQSSSAETGDVFAAAAAAAAAVTTMNNVRHPQQLQQQQQQHALQQAMQQQQQNLLQPYGARTTTGGNSFGRTALGSGGMSGDGDGDETGAMSAGGDRQPSKKKRTRNAEQMQQNRVAQQKYRERKKAEHEQLQNAMDQLTAQLAALKAMEAQAQVLRNQNAALTSTVQQQALRIQDLSIKVEAQATELVSARHGVAAATTLASNQQHMILDQHQKLAAQNEVIEALRGRLRDKMEDAFGSRDPKSVCQIMVAAVRTALEGAKNVDGLQESLAALPEPIITDICRAILCEVRALWPDLAERFQTLTGGNSIGPCGLEAKIC